MKFMTLMALLTTGGDFSTIERAIASVGFPIVVCIYTLWQSSQQNTKHAEDMKELTSTFVTRIDEITDKHKQEVAELSQAVNNNTVVMERLSTILEEKKE